MYEELLSLDDVRINFSAEGMHIINVVLAFVMFGVALGIRPSMFVEVFRKPKSMLVGLLSQIVGLPLVTFILIAVFHEYLTPMVSMGMILVAACPGGNISNFISQLSKANVELSVSLTAVVTLLAIFITPLNFALWGNMYVTFIDGMAATALRDLHIDVWQMFETVFLLLGVPLILGMLTAHYLPRVADKLKKPLQYLSIVFFILMVVLAFGNNISLFVKHIKWIFLIVLVHNGMALLTGYGLSSVFGLPRKDRRTVTIETGIQNSGLGLVLLFNPKIFPPELATGGMLFVTAWWGIWHIISGLSLAALFNRRSAGRGQESSGSD